MVVFLLMFYDLVLYTIDLLILLKFMDNQYGGFRHTTKFKYVMLIITVFISGLLLEYSGGTYTFFSVLISFLYLPFYKKSRQKQFLFSAIQLAASGYITLLMMAVISTFSINLRYIGLNYFILLSVMHFSFWGLITLLSRFNTREKITLPANLFGVVLAIPVSSLIVLIFFVIRNVNTDMQFSLEIPLLGSFIFINIMTAFIYSRLCDLLSRNQENLLLKQQLELSEKHFLALTDAQNKLKGIRHDMKNHLQTLTVMLKQPVPEIAGINDYINNLYEDIHDTSQVIATGNLALDSVLSLKITQINEHQIPLEQKITIPEGLMISSEDSIIILGNILDNAVNACLMLPPGERWIRLELTYITNCLFIRIANPRPQSGQKRIGQSDEEHGFGLNNVRTALQKYNGTIHIEDSNNTFTVKLVLYNV